MCKFLVALVLSFSACGTPQPVNSVSRCRITCDTVASTCPDFSSDECFDYCISLVTDEQLTDYEACADCYVDVSCDSADYGHTCSPICNN